jgi:hypothetical protein
MHPCQFHSPLPASTKWAVWVVPETLPDAEKNVPTCGKDAKFLWKKFNVWLCADHYDLLVKLEQIVE